MKSFVDEVAATPGGEHVKSCIQCGICTGSCPAAKEMEYAPRQMIALIRAGMKNEVLSSASMWHCLSCHLCGCRCPRGVKPSDLAHALTSLAFQQGYRVRQTSTPAMYRSFVGSMKGYGRVHEFGIMLRYYLMTDPLAALKVLPVGIKLFMHKRMPLLAKKAEGKAELDKILTKFKELRERDKQSG